MTARTPRSRGTEPTGRRSPSNQEPTRLRLALLWGLSVAALSIHNLEEWLLNLTAWMSQHPWLPGRSLHGDQFRFALALVLVAVAVAVLAAVAIGLQPAWSPTALTHVCYALAINGASHLVLSVMSWSLMPGAITGTLVLLPVGLTAVRSLPPMPWTSAAMAITALAAAGTVAGSLALAAALTATLQAQ